MSRCTVPARCAVSIALASLMPVLTASATDNGLDRTRTPRSGGGQKRITRNGRLSAVTPAVSTGTMLGWSPSRAIALASEVNSARSRSLSATSSRTTLTATRCCGHSCS